MPALAEKPEKVARVVPNAPWPVVQLGSLLREPLRNGHSAKSTGTAHGVRTLTLTAVTKGDFSDKNTKITSANPDRVSNLWLEAGDILIQRSNAPELVGTTRLYRGPSNFAIFPDLIIRVRLNSTAEPAYIELVLQSEALRTYFKKRAKGMSGSMPKIDQQTISEAPIPLPPLPEQRRIVAEIEQQFTRLDAGVAALRRTQANLKRYRAAVLKSACEGRLVPTEAELASQRGLGGFISTGDFDSSSHGSNPESRKRRSLPRGGTNGVPEVVSSDLTSPTGYETGEALLTRILIIRRKIHEQSKTTSARKKKYKEPISPAVPAGEVIPDGWTWATWDQIAFSQNGRPFPSAEYQDSGVKLLRPGNLHVSGKVVWTESNTRCMPPSFANENPDLIVNGGELVMNLTAQSLKDEFLGRVCVTGENERCLLNQRLARLTPIAISPRFALILLKGWRFRHYVDSLNSGSLIQHMFTSQLAEFTFGLPPLAEQTRIVAEVERRLSVVDELDSVVAVNLQRAT